MPTTLADLDPDARDIVDSTVSKLKFADNGDILVSVPLPSSQTIDVETWQPGDTTKQSDLEKVLQNNGMDSSITFRTVAAASLSGQCLNLLSKRSVAWSHLSARTPSTSTFDTAWDVACSDLVGAFTGDIGATACAGKDSTDKKEAIACMFTGCYNSPATVPTNQYTFSASFPFKNSIPAGTDVVTAGSGKKLTCIDCSIDIASISFTGSISIVLSTKEVKAANLVVTEKSKSSMIVNLLADGAWQYDWSTQITTLPLQPISVSGVFAINPSIVYSLSVSFDTDAAVNVQAGAQMTWTGASAEVDLAAASVAKISAWQPDVAMVLPTFKNNANVNIYPTVRRMFQFAISILGTKVGNTATLTSQTSIGFSAKYLTGVSGGCVGGQLQLKSFVSNHQKILFGNGVTKLLNSIEGNQPEQCFNVPDSQPSLSEIQALAALTDGQTYCTSLINYQPPISGVYVLGTSTTSASVTSVATVQIQLLPTTTITQTFSETTAITQVITTSLYYTTDGQGALSLGTNALRRRAIVAMETPPVTATAYAPRAALAMPTATSVPILKKRAYPYAAPPSIISDWSGDKASFACSQIAKGTVTRTFTTSTTTVTSGTTTVVVTRTVNPLGNAVTLSDSTTSTFFTWTTSTRTADYIAMPSACPLQTQVSCFNIVGHGRPSIEGKQLGVSMDTLSPGFHHAPSAFYLNCDGNLISLSGQRALGGTKYTNFMGFSALDSGAARAVCQKNPATKELKCTYQDNSIMW